MLRYGITIFLSAFLLFQVEPISARFSLPWFGGSPSVWTTCLLFFQLLLLGGYAYAHWLTERLSPRTQALVHVVLLGATLASLPIAPSPSWKPDGPEAPTARILLMLLATVGAPYFMLATTGPLVQAWFSRSSPGRSPYRLFAASNAGCLLALLSYPFVFEPVLRLRTQANVWSISYGVFAALGAWCAVAASRARAPIDAPAEPTSAAPTSTGRPPFSRVAYWTVLAALGSIMLVATTNQVSQDIAVVPLLWILPLALYLLTLILCFESDRWYVRPVFVALLGLCGPIAALVMRQEERALWVQIGVFSVTLFVACMCCHGEIARTRPEPRHLTLFYLAISAGGALGGVCVALVAPRVFTDFHEYLLGLGGVCFVAMSAYLKETARARGDERALLARFGPGLMIVALAAALEVRTVLAEDATVAQTRNFYGVLRVSKGTGDVKRRAFLTLESGRTTHGLQFAEPPSRKLGTTYYAPGSGGALAIRFHPHRFDGDPTKRSLKVGLLGLGIGTLATYGQPGDVMRFYELDPDDVALAQKHFSYLSDSRAHVEFALGDARVNLEHELRDGRNQGFDVLVADTFSGDSIPIHLLTREAADVYFAHLKPDGLLAIHITNRYLDLTSVVRALAAATGRQIASFVVKGDSELGSYDSSWVVLTRDPAFFTIPPVRAAITPWPATAPAPVLWTDDFSSLWHVLKD